MKLKIILVSALVSFSFSSAFACFDSLPERFKGFKKMSPEFNSVLDKINDVKWSHAREFKASPCDNCSLFTEHYENWVVFHGTDKNFAMDSEGNKSGVLSDASFRTGEEVAHIRNAWQKTLADGSILFLYEARRTPYIYERGPIKMIEWALVDDRFFSVPPNFDDIRDLQWKIYYANQEWTSVDQYQYLIIQYNPKNEKSLIIAGYKDEKAEAVVREFERQQ